MSINDPENSSEIDGLQSRIEGSLDDTKLILNNIESFGDDLDILARHLAKLGSHLPHRASVEPSEAGVIDPSDISSGDKQSESPAREELDEGMIEQETASINDEVENPVASGRPSVIKNNWKSPASHPSEEEENELLNELNENAETAIAEECKDALTRLRKHEDETEKRVAALTEKIDKEKNRQQDLKNNFDKETLALQEENDVLAREREARLQSVRTKAYALHAAGKYDEAVHAYQDYFDLLGNASSDIATLQASRECARQAEWERERFRIKRVLVVVLVMLLGFWFVGSIYVANRTVESARLAAGNADTKTLSIYCGRLESGLVRIGSFGAVGYMYGPEISQWRNQIDGAAQEHAGVVPVSENSNAVAEEGNSPAQDELADQEAIKTVESVPDVRGVSGLPLLPFGMISSGNGALIFNHQSAEFGNNRLELLLNPNGQYWVSIGKEGFEFYTEPFAANLIEAKKKHGPRAHSGENERWNSKRDIATELDIKMDYAGGKISLSELFHLMEIYEKQKLLKRWLELGGSRKDLGSLRAVK